MCGCSVTGWAQVLCVLGLSCCQGQRELGEEVSTGMSYLHSQKHPCLEQSLPWESPALHRRCQHPLCPLWEAPCSVLAPAQPGAAQAAPGADARGFPGPDGQSSPVLREHIQEEEDSRSSLWFKHSWK